MDTNIKLYQDISKRTNGDIYIGIVGPVRTGKSTFIKNFMDLLVIPNIDNPYQKERTTDELPQSASGKTIMTTEPKFIPNEAIEITLDNNVKLKTRLVDCVGYLVNNAIGHLENDMPRMVKTPWYDEEIPFEEAAELGTRKVIQEHSTIGILVTTDGSITDIPRQDYISAEERVVKELKAINKPFIIVLNSDSPNSEYTLELKEKLELKYKTPVIALDCLNLNKNDIDNIFNSLLLEFPIEQININFSKWIDGLNNSHWLKQDLFSNIQTTFDNISLLKQIPNTQEKLNQVEIISNCSINEIQLGTGVVSLNIDVSDDLFYKVLSEISNCNITNDEELFSTITALSYSKKEYDKIAFALNEVNTKGYGIVTPSMDELILAEPEMVKQGNRFGVKLKAKAPSIHIECSIFQNQNIFITI